MAQTTLPTDKAFRMAVKLVSTDGSELPFKGFMLVPEERLVMLEELAIAALDLVTRLREAKSDANKGLKVESAVTVLGDRVQGLQKIWDIPS